MNIKRLRDALALKRRAWIIGLSLTLSLLVASYALLVIPRQTTVQAKGNKSGENASVTAYIDPHTTLNEAAVAIHITWKCLVQDGAVPSRFSMYIRLSQGSLSSYGQYVDSLPNCAVLNSGTMMVPSPGFQPGTADVSVSSATLFYYPDSTMYDLDSVSKPLLDKTVIIKPYLTFSVSVVGPSTVNAGALISYNIHVHNPSPGTAFQVKIVDILPNNAGLQWTMGTRVGSWGIKNGVLSLGSNDLAAEASDGIIIVSPTTRATCGTVINSATMASKNAGSASSGKIPITVICP